MANHQGCLLPGFIQLGASIHPVIFPVYVPPASVRSSKSNAVTAAKLVFRRKAHDFLSCMNNSLMFFFYNDFLLKLRCYCQGPGTMGC